MSFSRLARIAAPALLLLSGLFSSASGQAYGLTERPDVDAYYDGTFPAEAPVIPSDWSAVLAFPNLTFLNPVGLIPIPGTNKLIVWEREGKIWVFDNIPTVSTKTLLVDMSPNTQGWDDSGMLGVAAHPDFANNRQIFLWYNWRGGVTGGSGDNGPILGSAGTRPPTGTPTRNRLSRFTLDANYQANKANEHVIIDQKDVSVWHNGGGMFFHPQNGFLYITNGDDTNTDHTQRINRSLFSCVIRIDVDQRGGSISHAPTLRPQNEVAPAWPRYFVPNDNPFVGQAGALEEIYALGLRSPHRMSIDPVTGRIFIGDVGASSREEISVIEPSDPPGLNFQWSRLEGIAGDLTAPYIGTNKRPVIDYSHGTDDGSCIVGGYVYRGSQFPELAGKYIFGDNMSGRVWYLDETTTPATKKLLTTLPDGPGPNPGNDYRGLGSFGLDAAGEIYLCRLSSEEGRIYKLQRGGGSPGTPLPATLGATGFFSDLATLTPSNRLLPYDINAPFWSDGAVKKRFAAIPNGSAAGFQPTGEWSFPTGSVFVKHFDLPVSDVDPNAKRRLETRFIVKKEDGSVYGATYKWRADQSDADLLDGSLTESIPITTASLGTFTGQDIGNPALGGSTTRNGNQVTITAGGTDIWGTSDQFHFAHQLRSGDFDVAVRVESVVEADPYTKTGLMVRDSLAANARHVMALVFPSNAERNNNDGGYEFQYRASTGGNATALYPPQPQPRVNYPETWLRMKREGDTFIAYSGSDGFTWREYARTTLDFPDEIRFGLAVTAHTASPRTTAKFQIETRRQPWFYPSRQNCVTCHTTQSGGVLGLSTRQLNKDQLFPSTGVTDNQIRAWSHVGLLDDGPDESGIPLLEKLAHYTDTSASLEKRARSYLDANCSYCHRPGGVQALWDGRYQIPLPDQGIYYGPVVNNLGIPDARVVVPQDLVKSILHRRVSITGENQMPPIARNLVDHGGVAVLEQWIQSLEMETVEGPDSLIATAISHTRVDLTWQDRSDNEAGFSIERSIDGLNFTAIAITGPGVTGFSDTGADPFSTNYYRVSSFGDYVYSTPSNVASAVTDIGPPAPEIRVVGNGRIIPNGDLEPGYRDGTDFRAVLQPAARTFTLENIGNDALQLTGSPRITFSGADAASFSVVEQPPASLTGPGNFNFQIRFSPQGAGLKTATVTIQSNDSDEGSYRFAIRGMAVAQDLVGWWKFDEGSGPTAFDATGSGRNGNLQGPLPQWNPEGHFNGALRFTGEVDQGVVVGNHASLNITGDISITAWAFALDWDGNRRILQKGNTDNQYRLLAENGDLVWDINDVGRLETALPLPGKWFHVAATYDGEWMRLYLNGVEVAAGEAEGAIPASGNALNIGTKTTGAPGGDHFNGDLDDIRLYARALPAEEIGLLASQAGVVSITSSDNQAQKGTANTGTFKVTRTGSTTNAVQVGLTLTSGNGQAIPGADYALAPAYTGFAIPAGQASANLTLNALDRSRVTGPLVAELTLGEAEDYIPGTENSAAVEILDSPLNQWKISPAGFGSLAAAQGPLAEDTADGDGDGLGVLLEAALGGSPATEDSRLRPQAAVELIEGQHYLTLTYKRPRPVLGGITLIHRTNFDLASGTWAPAVGVPGYPLNHLDGTETVKVRSAEPIDATPRQFIRLEVSRP